MNSIGARYNHTMNIEQKSETIFSLMRKLGITQTEMSKGIGVNRCEINKALNVRNSNEIMDKCLVYLRGKGE